MKYALHTILLLMLLALASCGRIGEGTSQDTIFQVQKSGLIWKTTEIWLTNEHQTETDSNAYCIEDPALQEIARAALRSKTKCTIEYHDEFIIAPWRCGADTVADDIYCEEN